MKVLSEQFIQKAIHNVLENQKCSDLHPGMSCNIKMCHQFIATFKSLYKMYLLVHLIPFIIFKRKKLKQRPIQEIKNLVKGFIKSMLFAGGYTVIVRRTICFMTQHNKYQAFNGAIGAFLGGLTLNFEPPGRQSQIALYCVNKTIETLYHMGLRRKYPIRIQHGECLLVGVAVSIICYHYIACPAAIRENYQKVLDRVLGNI